MEQPGRPPSQVSPTHRLLLRASLSPGWLPAPAPNGYLHLRVSYRQLIFAPFTVKQINGVVRDLCQGSAKEQTAAVKNYFLPEASFLHPFCWVPSFSNVNVPLIGAVNSRVFIQAIFRWYRLLSPKVDLEIHSSGAFLAPQH